MRPRQRIAAATLVVVLAAAAAPERLAAQPPPVPAQSAPPERDEPGLEDRARRHARGTWERLGILPARLLRLPFQAVNFPLENYLIHKEPGAITVYTGRIVRRLETGGLYVRFGGVGTGSGTGPGLRYEIAPWRRGPELQLLAATTYRGYDLVRARVDSIRAGGIALGFEAAYGENPQEDFFGLGSQSRLENRGTYQLDTWRARLDGGMRFGAWHAGIDLAGARHDLGRGRDPDHPSVEQVFEPGDLEGLHGRFEFVEYGAHLRFDSRDLRRYARRGTYFEAAVAAADGARGTPYAHTKYLLEIARFAPLPGWRRSVAGRLRAVWTDNRGDGGAAVPVFLLERLGGSRSLRGYETFRFHAEESLLGNLEYRFPIWEIGLPRHPALDGVVFFDFGTTIEQLRDLRQRDLHSSAGLGLRVATAADLLVRFDNAWTPEGYRAHLGLRGTF